MAKRDPQQQIPPGAGVLLPNGSSAPFVHPGVSKEAVDHAAAYGVGLAARRAQNQLPKDAPGQAPVAGGKVPPIPRLDGPAPSGGRTMSQIAQTQRGRQTVPQQQPQQGGDFVERPVMHHAQTPANLGILPMDTLPAEARNDPAFRTGNGDMFASNQPEMAQKYGVVRKGQLIPAQALVNPSGDRPPLRPETLADIERIKELQQAQQAPNTHLNDMEAELSASDASRAAATVGNLPGDTSPQPLSEEDRAKLEQAVKEMDEYEFDAWRQAMMKDLLNQPEQKEIIESRLTPMDLGDLVTQGFISQRVPIVHGQFEPTFMTVDGESDLALKRLIMEDSKSLEVSDRYYLDKFSLMGVAAAVQAINGKEYPPYRDDEGNFDDELFLKKFSMVLKLPLHMLASLGVNALWFDVRVRKLFVAEKLGNG